MAHVFANFEMPGVALVPDYDSRILKMREAGIDRSVFIQKVYMPDFEVPRRDAARDAARRKAHAGQNRRVE